MARFSIDFGGSVDLDTAEVWPDGDAPEHPTLADVLTVMRRERRIDLLRDWGLSDSLEIMVGDNKTGEHEEL